MEESLVVDVLNDEHTVEGNASTKPLLEVSVSFGRFENDLLSWEKWSTFSPNKYLEEVEKYATPGSVAQKRAYFEAHYKKIADRKTKLLEQEREMEFNTTVSNGGADLMDHSERADSESETSNHHVSVEEVDQSTMLTGEVSSSVYHEVVKNDVESNVECESLPDGEKEEPEGKFDCVGSDSEIRKQEEVVVKEVETPTPPVESSQTTKEPPQKSVNKVSAISKVKQQILKPNRPKESKKTTPIVKERNSASVKKKPVSSTAKAPQTLTPKLSKTTPGPTTPAARGGNSWYVATDIPSDLLVQVEGVNFHLHKYPLLSRSGKMNRCIYESRDPDLNKIILDDLPGGAEAFELAAKFCYGIAVDLTAANISGLRCAAEYLEMTEDLEEGNLIFKTEAFLSYVVLSSWRDSIVVLKSCEKLSPWAENLQIVRRCSESIAWKACANPKGIRWAYTGKPPKVSSPKWNDLKDSSPSRNQLVPPDWWFEDVSILRIDHFVRVITAIKVKGMRFELIGSSIMHYSSKWLPGLVTDATNAGDEGSTSTTSNTSSGSNSWKGGLHMIVAGNKEDHSAIQAKDQRMIIESLISIIPPQKDCVSCSFLLKLLRMANMLKVAPALVTELEKRVGMQFEQAALVDLLIPSYSKSDTMYDVDLIQRLLEHFLVQEQTEISSPSRQSFSDKHMYDGSQRGVVPNAKMRVARLVDSYLTEVARDRNLSLTKFQVLAEALPESARTCDDGLYRAIDSYLKAHPTLTEHERKRLCRVMDCQKLSIDACMHAAQNERLPLRVVVQVLFSEQVKISNAIANSSLKEANDSQFQPLVTNRKTLLEATPQSFQEGWATAKKDINTLKFELESMKTKYLELQTEMESLQRQCEKVTKQKQSSAWSSGWKKLSKLTKISTLETPENESQHPIIAEQTKKVPRRWRNSIS